MSFRPKYPKNLEFQVNTEWNGKLGGKVKTEQGYHVEFEIPELFGGHGKAVCPDELFAASVAGCLMHTFLHTRERLGLEMKAFSLQTRVNVNFECQRYQITKITVGGILTVEEGEEELGEECLYFAKKYCHISRS